MLETTYGDAKRLAFLRRIIEARTPAQILDIGCGTGTRVTRPLADAFPSVRFLGVDADETSIAWARGNNREKTQAIGCGGIGAIHMLAQRIGLVD